MVHIVNSSQQITHAVLSPQSIHSRSVGFEVIVPAGLGETGIGFTPPLADSLRLLGVDLWMFDFDPGVLIGGFISIRHGNTEPTIDTEISVNWDMVMQFSGIKPMMRWVDSQSSHFHWNMNQLWTGPGQRFACEINNFSATDSWSAWVFFEISEG